MYSLIDYCVVVSWVPACSQLIVVPGGGFPVCCGSPLDPGRVGPSVGSQFFLGPLH